MEKLNCILLVDDSISSNFLKYRLLKKMNIAQRIEMEKNTIYAMQFIQYFLEVNDNFCPELIILNANLVDRIEFLNLLKRLTILNKKPVRIIASASRQLLESFTMDEENYMITFLNKELLPTLQTLLINDKDKLQTV